MSKQNRWDEMTDLIDDEVLETIAVVGERHEIAGSFERASTGLQTA